MTETISNLKKQLAQLRELHAAGVIPTEQYEAARAPLERRIVDDLLSPAAAPLQSSAIAGTGSAQGRNLKTPLLLAGLVVVVAAGGYAWKGAPTQWGAATPAGLAAQPAGTASPHSTNAEQIAAMTDKLAARMQTSPEDAEGWAMLARSYSVIGKYKDAEAAYRKATALRKDDAALWTDFADALAMNQGGKLVGEPMQLVEKALKLDPANAKALSLSGTYAFGQKRYAEAVTLWERVVQTGDPEDPVVKQSSSSLAEARELAGLPAKTGTAQRLSAAAPSAATVSGLVRLSPALAQRVSPTDTVFVFARSADPAQRMPLAILRKQAKDLPFEFTLDDSLAMSPGNTLSSHKVLVVGARVSKSGNAMPQAGDFAALSKELPLGAKNVSLDIADEVKP